MNWDNVKLIFHREIRDQARDRRTLFSVIGLPVLLYPLLGLMTLYMLQFQQSHPTNLRVIGFAEIPETPPLIVEQPTVEGDEGASPRYQFADSLLLDAGIESEFEIDVSGASIDPQVVAETARESLAADSVEAILYFPPGFRDRVEKFRKAKTDVENAEADGKDVLLPAPSIFADSSNDRSGLAKARIDQILHTWRERVIQKNLEANDVPEEITNPFRVEKYDFSDKPTAQTQLWPKVFPFIVVIWALTGAFYPAIDLCAGEKERGTLETLLSSPARRSEIVAGKMLAIMLFSVATSLLNLMSMGVTAGAVLGQMTGSVLADRLGAPPIWSLGWLVVALIPMAALFSALALAIAAMARSSKEGQYYLLPLLMLNLPLVVLPVLPDTELTFGTALIPVSGMSFLLKTLMEGKFSTAATYALPVLGMTSFCVWASVRWAIDQFNNESVLFRESERFSLRLWLIKVWRDRKATPSVGGAFLMGIVILAMPHMFGVWLPKIDSTTSFAMTLVISQTCFILLPALVAGFVFTRNVRKTFLLRFSGWASSKAWQVALANIGVAAALAITLHPFVLMLRGIIEQALPMPQELQERLLGTLGYAEGLPLWGVLCLFALLPAICEEFAFRGFILSGLRHIGHKWAAIAITAIFFGITHQIIQQSVAAIIIGLLIGFIAVQTRSLLACIVYHAIHNALGLIHGLVTEETLGEYPALKWLFSSADKTPGEASYHLLVVVVCLIGVMLSIRWLQRLPSELTAEERRVAALGSQENRTSDDSND